VTLARIAVDTAEQKVGPTGPKLQDFAFWLNMFHGKMSLNLALAVATVVAKTVLQIEPRGLIRSIVIGSHPSINGTHFHPA
jgi:hypothetical protein